VAIRLDLAEKSLDAVVHSYGFGLGAGSIEPWIASNSPLESGVTSVHNWWGEILANYGILILVGYIAFYLGLIRALFLARRSATESWEKQLSEVLILALVGFSIACVGSSSIIALRVQWLVFAFVLAFVQYARRRTRELAVG
jgi:teichuronic acid biosynthesis protein TuaE